MSKYLDPDFDDDLILDEQTVEGTAEEEVQVVDPKQLNILQLIERIVNLVEDSELKKSALDEVKGETEELASRLDITPADRLLKPFDSFAYFRNNTIESMAERVRKNIIVFCCKSLIIIAIRVYACGNVCMCTRGSGEKIRHFF